MSKNINGPPISSFSSNLQYSNDDFNRTPSSIRLSTYSSNPTNNIYKFQVNSKMSGNSESDFQQKSNNSSNNFRSNDTILGFKTPVTQIRNRENLERIELSKTRITLPGYPARYNQFVGFFFIWSQVCIVKFNLILFKLFSLKHVCFSYSYSFIFNK